MGSSPVEQAQAMILDGRGGYGGELGRGVVYGGYRVDVLFIPFIHPFLNPTINPTIHLYLSNTVGPEDYRQIPDRPTDPSLFIPSPQLMKAMMGRGLGRRCRWREIGWELIKTPNPPDPQPRPTQPTVPLIPTTLNPTK